MPDVTAAAAIRARPVSSEPCRAVISTFSVSVGSRPASLQQPRGVSGLADGPVDVAHAAHADELPDEQAAGDERQPQRDRPPRMGGAPPADADGDRPAGRCGRGGHGGASGRRFA